ncbi:VWA domain-containing protein [Candidatus Micrarchaeota archaeon]|nr:VWA domain-containing protein [Candidatus Micrarchaeota archaeon]
MTELVFTNPGNLWYIVVVPFAILLHFLSIWHRRDQALAFANFEVLQRATKERQSLQTHFSLLLSRVLVLCCLVLAVSGAAILYEGAASSSDYVIAVDTSYSMLANDYAPSRIAAARKAALEFVNSVPQQGKVGLVSFSGTPVIEAKPTQDLSLVRRAIMNLNVSDASGTAIGESIVTSVNLITGLDRGKAVILITDGQNNVGINPDDAVAYAKDNKVTIFTIGMGTKQGGSIEGIPLKTEIDEDSLRSVALQTGGNYYPAGNAELLAGGFRQIAVSSSRNLTFNLQPVLVFLAALLLFVEWWLANIKFVRIEWGE